LPVGRSALINFLGWDKPLAVDIEVIEKLGNPGWNWADYQNILNDLKREPHYLCALRW